MRRTTRFIILIASIAALATAVPATSLAQRRRPPATGRVEPRPPARRGTSFVFVGGYFYDPFFGPYPWWARHAYPYPYYPLYDNRAVVRLLVTPEDAAVYADGFYAGIVDDFDGFFQGLPLPPGGHEITLYLAGYRTVRERVYLSPGSTFKLRDTMVRLPAGEVSEPPQLAPPIPEPPVGTFTAPRTRGPIPPPPSAPTSAALGYGTLSLHVQPDGAEVWIDGERWASTDSARLVIEVSADMHRVEIVKNGYRTYSTDVVIREGETTPLNVSLMREGS
jgi:PEGA domain-containing protein